MKLLILAFVLTGCQHMYETDHSEMMLSCRTMCNKQVRAYSTITGECECYQKKNKTRSSDRSK